MNLGRENEYLEFKETTAELNDAIIDICAILNKSGRGELYFGVKDDGDVVGFEIGKETLRDISQRIDSKLKPQIFPVIETNDKLKIVKITFEGAHPPYSADGKYYIRVVDQSKDMGPDELSRYIIQKNYQNWEKQKTNETIDDIDEEQLKIFYEKAIEAKRIEEFPYDKKNILEKLKLLYDGYFLNNAGRYLFSKNGPIQLKMAVFATNEKRTFIDISPINGNVFSLIDEAQKYIKKNIRWRVEINGFDRKDIPEIPVEALREIVVNSFAHADYLSPSKNEIDIFPNRVAIYNAGSFPEQLTPEDFVKKTLSSKIRNELICDVLYKCKEVETWGTGFSKTYKYCDEKNVKCGYEKEMDGFWFIFYRHDNVTTNVTDVTINVTKELSELELLVFEEIKKNGNVTREILAKITGRNSRTIQRVLNSLREKSLIRRIGYNKNGHWEVVG